MEFELRKKGIVVSVNNNSSDKKLIERRFCLAKDIKRVGIFKICMFFLKGCDVFFKPVLKGKPDKLHFFLNRRWIILVKKK